MLLIFDRFTTLTYIFISISFLVAIYITFIAMKNKSQPLKKYIILAIISFAFIVAALSTLSSSPTKIQPVTEKSAISYNVVIEVHKDYISVVDLSDNKKFDINISKTSPTDYYVNDIVNDAGNIQIFGQALEKAQAQIPSIGTAVSLPSS